MQKRKVVAMAVGVVLTLAGGWAALGATLGAIGLGEDTNLVGDRDPVVHATPSPEPSPTTEVTTIFVDPPAPSAPPTTFEDDDPGPSPDPTGSPEAGVEIAESPEPTESPEASPEPTETPEASPDDHDDDHSGPGGGGDDDDNSGPGGDDDHEDDD